VDPGPEWHPAQHPEPPVDLDRRAVPMLDVGPPWFHCHTLRRGPLSFNRRSTGRFNAPGGEFGVLYLSTSREGAFIETFGQSGSADDRGVRFVTRAALDARCLCSIAQTSPARSLHLIDLSGSGLSQIGADARLGAATDDPGLPQRWALAFWNHPAAPDGLLYRARHDPEQLSVAVFDRAGDLLGADCSTNVLARPDILIPILRRYGFGIDRV
jgi:hypothetical protein